MHKYVILKCLRERLHCTIYIYVFIYKFKITNNRTYRSGLNNSFNIVDKQILMDRIQIKCVVMGDIKVGKTSLIMSYAYNMFQEEDIPLVFDFKTTVTENDKPVDLVLWDTCGNANYNKLRPVSLPDTDVFLLCFSLDDPDSFAFIEENCFPDIKRLCPNALILLVGTKKDLIDVCQNEQETRKKDTGNSYAYEHGINLAERIQAVKYIECSSKTGEGIKSVLQEAIKCIFNKTKRFKENISTCNVL
ncbi:ras-related protein Rac2-like isoform X1 [Mytilus galloprovincialis]|uniref:ras-related protein Rac2-like isoform X1 n=1 Tax=Mytilus galloprovincialis TaxID=29158 RepID=UPI003F7CB0B1